VGEVVGEVVGDISMPHLDNIGGLDCFAHILNEDGEIGVSFGLEVGEEVDEVVRCGGCRRGCLQRMLPRSASWYACSSSTERTALRTEVGS